MGKAPTSSAAHKRRHNPLEDDMLATGILKNRTRSKRGRGGSDDDTEQRQAYVDAKASRRILELGRGLAEEDQQRTASPATKPSPFAVDSNRLQLDQDEHHDQDAFENEEPWGDDDDEDGKADGVDAGDLAIFNRFMPTTDEDPLLVHGWDGAVRGGSGTAAMDDVQAPPTSLADLILAKIAEKEAGIPQERGGVGSVDEDYEVPPKVADVFGKIGLILHRYKSGPLPKPFKVLPSVPHWEQILECTQPDLWTPNSVYAATRIFISAKQPVAQRFVEMVILDKVREDIRGTKRLNVHLFNSLKRALFKPPAFFKGFLFPLVASGTCTLREAHIISSVLARVSIPVLHSAAALKMLCDIAAEQASQRVESSSAMSYFIKVLLEKNYALPWQVVDSVVFHFLRFRSVDPASVKEAEAMKGIAEHAVSGSLPVLFHQCLLAFAQRYRNDITEDQREALLDLLMTHGHHQIAPEVRKELLAGRGRGVPAEQPGATFDGDDTMMMMIDA